MEANGLSLYIVNIILDTKKPPGNSSGRPFLTLYFMVLIYLKLYRTLVNICLGRHRHRGFREVQPF